MSSFHRRSRTGCYGCGLDPLSGRAKHRTATIVDAVEKEFRCFMGRPDYLPHELWPLAGRDPLLLEYISERLPATNFRLADLLLFKHDSHRVGAVGAWEILPVEWRLDAYRTILPDELPGQLKKWMDYRTAVIDGSFRGYLEETLLYVCQIRLGEQLLQAKATVQRSLDRTPSWVDRPEVIAARAAISILSEPEPPKPPKLNLDVPRDAFLDLRWRQIEDQRASLEEATNA